MSAGGAPPVGRLWPARPYVAEATAIRAYAEAVGERSPIHHDAAAARAAGFAGPVAPPAFAAVVCAAAVAAVIFDPEVGLFDPEVGLSSYRFVHKRQRFRWHRPIVAGDELETRASLAGAGSSADGRPRRVFESETVDARGEPVVSGRYEGVVPSFGGSRKRRDRGREEPAPPVKPVERPAAAGDGFPPLAITPGPQATRRYAEASGDFTPFHLDDEAAKAVGLPGVILHGLYSYALVARAHTAPFGSDPRALAELSAGFRRPAFPGRPLRVRLEVSVAARGRLETRGELLQGGRPVIDGVEGVVVPR